MIHLSDTIEIRVVPERVFDWFADLPAHYKAWHPDHVTCRFVTEGGMRAGAWLYAEEYLHGNLHRLRFRITRLVPPEQADYRIAPGLTGSFIAARSPDGTRFTATLDLGVSWPVLGALIDRAMLAIFGRKLDAVRQHMREEGLNLKRILERETPETAPEPGAKPG